MNQAISILQLKAKNGVVIAITKSLLLIAFVLVVKETIE
jgi:hypothetical protein